MKALLQEGQSMTGSEGGSAELRAGCMFTRSTDDTIRRAVSKVRAGRPLAPSHWPNGGQVAVAITFDVDHEFPVYRAEPAILSLGEYGATTALPRLLAILDRHQIPATFFIPGATQVVYPQTVEQILAAGKHEIALHGWVHERAPDLEGPEEEADLITRSIRVLSEAAGGRKIVGYRAPNNAPSVHTFALLEERGVIYDSSLAARDSAYELLLDGNVAGIIEVPNSWEAGDYIYLHHDEFWRGSLPWPDAVFEVWKSDFDVAYAERTVFNLTLHPQVIGRRSRAVMLDKFLAYVRSKCNVWFATLAEIAQYAKAHP
jgi:peptidoglycan/xylan/chitin deacetylase (PgdA/CDA1 family)